MLASLYQRGLTFEEAFGNKEFMYINFWKKAGEEKINTLDALLKYQEGYMLADSPDAEINLLEGVRDQKGGAKSLIRRFKKKTYPTPEYTGFVDFEKFIFMCVLFSPEQLERKNLRKLRFVMRDLLPLTVTRDNNELIRAAEARLSESVSPKERAQLLSKIGWYYRDMDRMQDARKLLEQSLALVPDYETIKQLLATLTKLGENEAALTLMGQLLRLDPANPTVFEDCVAYACGSNIGSADLVGLFENLKRDYPSDQRVQGSCDFYIGRLLVDTDPLSARNRFSDAQTAFRGVLSPDHHVFEAIRTALQHLGPAVPS